ncbi:cell wall hydrolase [Azospirillum baldaniorum]|uniref:Cell wall hydrolyse n=1 Tax=Azospirillum baldaniorum TaxID=1064539 RepID=A0A9P1JTC6_9PROT|nr:cell wall hydrolase [Azospirillum baldaniorum]AWJ88947.1 cell wall hydrolase [Azospirillum baldaniorum]TWA62453.1 cell wall hydrolase [Azospirillum baldaniorum]TWA73338.1 cell wall hydrolase [Azospirillum brasilense]CCC99337.1 putative cell wall hydrolyse [Azospirillum baldaniorum]
MRARVLKPEPGSAVPPQGPSADPPGQAVDTLARTLWGEARGESVRAMEAVAAVVMNRVSRARDQGGWWWGNDVVAVCRLPGQFPCWDPDAPGRLGLLSVTAADPVFAAAQRIARRAVAGLLDDPTGGATHLHRAGANPQWAQGRSVCAEIGGLQFYDDVE